jgi:hypothetical protein
LTTEPSIGLTAHVGGGTPCASAGLPELTANTVKQTAAARTARVGIERG